jgi:uncharacterized delta-60 repeat protein
MHRASPVWGALAIVLLAGIFVGGSVTAASSGEPVIVSATVPSATWLSVDPAGTAPAGNCKTGVANRTSFGTVLPGMPAVTTQDCEVVFGSSNDTSMLQIGQADGYGKAMWMSGTGALDGAFAGTGTATLLIGTASGWWGVDHERDGDLVVVGAQTGPGASRVALARYSATGTLDTGNFGAPNGYVTTVIGNSSEARDVVVQEDGKILVGGYADLGAGNGNDFLLARYNTNGSLDTSFGAPNGYVVTGLSTGWDYVEDIAVQPDGKIVVGGTSAVGGSGRMVVARYTASGALDTSTFASPNGYLPINPTGDTESGSGIALQPDGKILLSGTQHSANTRGILARITSSGALDTANFGAPNGWVMPLPTGLCSTDHRAVALQDNGAIVVGGMAALTGCSGDGHAYVARFLSNGTLDTTGFGATNGYATYNSVGCYDTVEQLAIQPNGSIVGFGGADGNCVGPNNRYLIGRVTSAGVLDTTFGSPNGYVMTNPGGAGRVGKMTYDGRLALVGTSASGGRIIQYAGGTTVQDYNDTLNDDWSTPGAGLFGVCLRSVTDGASTDGTSWTADSASTTDELAINADCGDGDADPWKPVPATLGGSGSKIAVSSVSGDGDAKALLRFGFRPTAVQTPGVYAAPVLFGVVAPNVP